MGSTRQKLAKLRRNPGLFFADARSPAVRRWTKHVAAMLDAHPRWRDSLVDPVGEATRSDLSLIRWGAGAFEARQRRRRRAAFERAGWPLISVVMPARDAESTVTAAMASVLAQTYPALELIVVDDGSADRTRALALAIADRRVRVIDGAGRGAADARNRGLAASRGAFLTFHDADDTSDPTRLARQLDVLLSEPRLRLCLVSYRRVDAEGRVVEVNGRRTAKSILSMLFGRPVLERVGFFQSLRVGEDAEYYGRIKAVYGPDCERVLMRPLYDARFSPDSLLFCDGEVTVDGLRVTHVHPEHERQRQARWERRHERIARGEVDPYVAGSEG